MTGGKGPSHSAEHERDASAQPGPRGIDALLEGNSFDRMISGMDNLKSKAAQTGSEMQSSLSVEATPVVNTSSLDNALAKARELFRILQQAGSVADGATASTGREMRRNLADYGVAP